MKTPYEAEPLSTESAEAMYAYSRENYKEAGELYFRDKEGGFVGATS
jgi:hypothetical protein